MKKITTYNDLGDIIKVETITTKLSYLQIIYKLYMGLMIVTALILIISNIYFCYSFSFCKTSSLIVSIGFLMFFIGLYSIGEEE